VDLSNALFALAAAIFAISTVVERRRRREARRALTDVPETSIAAVKDGEMVRLKGRAVTREALRTSPISQRHCIAYRLIVLRRDESGLDWQRIIEDDAFHSFLLADDTGEAVLHAPFEIKLNPHRETFVEALSPELASLLTREGVSARDLFGRERHFSYVEHVVMPGDEIMAIGRATIEIDPGGRSPSPRDAPVMCHLKGAAEPVIIAGVDESSDLTEP
jgi:hypothetical protein